MKVSIVKMFKEGVEIERRMLNDRYTVRLRGVLTIADETQQGRHRPIKIARLVSPYGGPCELYDVRLVWLNENRMTLAGDERTKNAEGKTVCYSQAWLVILDRDLQN